MNTNAFVIPSEKTLKIVEAQNILRERLQTLANRRNSMKIHIGEYKKAATQFKVVQRALADPVIPEDVKELLPSSALEEVLESEKVIIKHYCKELKEHRHHVIERRKKLAVIERKYADEKVREYTAEDILAAFADKISSAVIKEGNIIITTAPLLAKVNKYNAGKFILLEGDMIPIKPIEVTITGTMGKVYFKPFKHPGYNNGFNNKAAHPHIMSENKACWGDFAGLLSESWASQDLLLYIDMILLFLQQVNADGDRAGESWPRMFWSSSDLERPAANIKFTFDENLQPIKIEKVVPLPKDRVTVIHGVDVRFWEPGFEKSEWDLTRRRSGQLYFRRADGMYTHALEYFLTPPDKRDGVEWVSLKDENTAGYSSENLTFWKDALPKLEVPAPSAEVPVPAPVKPAAKKRKVKAPVPAVAEAVAPEPVTYEAAAPVPVPAPTPVEDDIAALDAIMAAAEVGATIVR